MRSRFNTSNARTAAVVAALDACTTGCGGATAQGHTDGGNGGVVRIEFQSGGEPFVSTGRVSTARTYSGSGKTLTPACEGDKTDFPRSTDWSAGWDARAIDEGGMAVPGAGVHVDEFQARVDNRHGSAGRQRMNTRARMAMVVLAAAPPGIGALARAEPTLRYNYDYVCGQERVVVGHCRHDGDTPGMPPTKPEDDYCQLYYPDRPKRGGIEAMEVVLRGDVIRMLQQCAAFGVVPDGRPSVKPMPIGPEMCPLLRRLEGLAREDFRSIDLGPDRTSGKDAETYHRASMSIPGAECYIFRSPGEPVAYRCNWPPAPETEVDKQFVDLGKALETCSAQTLDLSQLEFGDVKVKLHGIEYTATAISTKQQGDFLSLDVHMADPGRPAAPTGSSAAAPAPTRAGNGATQPGTEAEAPQQFCKEILHLRSLARQGFRSIDLGPMKGEAADVHESSIRLLNGKCLIARQPGANPNYRCGWGIDEKSRVDVVGNWLASCFNARVDWVDRNGVRFIRIDSASVEYRLIASAGTGMLVLNVQPTVPMTGTTR